MSAANREGSFCSVFGWYYSFKMADRDEWDRVFMDISRIFGFTELDDDQKMTLKEVVDNNRDVFVFKKTGSGKSVHFQALPIAAKLRKTTERPVLIVVCPLISVMKEHSENLVRLGLCSTYIGKDAEDDNRVLNGNFDVIFSSPEHIVGHKIW